MGWHFHFSAMKLGGDFVFREEPCPAQISCSEAAVFTWERNRKRMCCSLEALPGSQSPLKGRTLQSMMVANELSPSALCSAAGQRGMEEDTSYHLEALTTALCSFSHLFNFIAGSVRGSGGVSTIVCRCPQDHHHTI